MSNRAWVERMMKSAVVKCTLVDNQKCGCKMLESDPQSWPCSACYGTGIRKLPKEVEEIVIESRLSWWEKLQKRFGL